MLQCLEECADVVDHIAAGNADLGTGGRVGHGGNGLRVARVSVCVVGEQRGRGQRNRPAVFLRVTGVVVRDRHVICPNDTDGQDRLRGCNTVACSVAERVDYGLARSQSLNRRGGIVHAIVVTALCGERQCSIDARESARGHYGKRGIGVDITIVGKDVSNCDKRTVFANECSVGHCDRGVVRSCYGNRQPRRNGLNAIRCVVHKAVVSRLTSPQVLYRRRRVVEDVLKLAIFSERKHPEGAGQQPRLQDGQQGE